MTNVVISSAARTAVGSYGKSLKDVPATELGVIASRAAIERAQIEPDAVDHVVFGNVIHTRPEDMYMARVVGMNSGIPQGDAGVHRQPAVRHGRPGDRVGGAGDPDRRGAGRARRWRGVDESRAVLDARCALGIARWARRR